MMIRGQVNLFAFMDEKSFFFFLHFLCMNRRKKKRQGHRCIWEYETTDQLVSSVTLDRFSLLNDIGSNKQMTRYAESGICMGDSGSFSECIAL